LNSEEGQNQIARAIADAIISYRKEYYGSGAVDEGGVKPSDRVSKEPPVQTPDPDTVVTRPVAKVPPVKTTPVKPDVKSEPVNPATSVIFKVQLAASSTKLDLTPANFNGLSAISVLMAGNIYKYMYGQTGDYNEAKRLQGEAKSKGYGSAFVVAFNDGKKVTIDEALKLQQQQR